MIQAFAKVMPATLKKKFEAEKERVIGEAVEYAFANCGTKPGEILTEEQVKKLSRLVSGEEAQSICSAQPDAAS